MDKNPLETTRQGLEEAGYKFAAQSKCRGCSAVIFWFQTPAKKRMPFEIAINIEGSDPVLRPHWPSCPQAKEFRKPKGRSI
jgi:hypothetical protein